MKTTENKAIFSIRIPIEEIKYFQYNKTNRINV